MDEAIKEFRPLKDEGAINGKHVITNGEPELLKLNDGWSLVQSLNEDRFLLRST